MASTSSPEQRGSNSRSAGAQVGDRLGVVAELVHLVWSHRLWWMVPLLLALLVLGLLLTLQATPVGPLIYPVF